MKPSLIEQKKRLYFIVGPTSSGKTEISIKLAKVLEAQEYAMGRSAKCEIISADSRQVYRYFDLSSGKVTKEEMRDIPHHMLDIVDPGQKYTVVDYVKDATRIIEEVLSRGNIPIVVGGTGFYIDSLIYDYDLPQVKMNEELRKELESRSTEQLFIELESIDPEYAAQHNNAEFKNNRHRLVRAVEIARALGNIPALNKKERYGTDEFQKHIIFTETDQDSLKEKIKTRIVDRLQKGMVAEIQRAMQKYNLSYEYLESLGLEFKYVSRLLQKQIDESSMIEELAKEHIQYARRQDTWFRRYKK